MCSSELQRENKNLTQIVNTSDKSAITDGKELRPSLKVDNIVEITPLISNNASGMFNTFLREFLTLNGPRIVYKSARINHGGTFRIVFVNNHILEEYIKFFNKNCVKLGSLIKKSVMATIKINGAEPCWDKEERGEFISNNNLHNLNFLKSRNDGSEINVAFAKTDKANAEKLCIEKHLIFLGVYMSVSLIEIDEFTYPHCQHCHRWGHWGSGCEQEERCPTCVDKHTGQCKTDFATCCNCGKKHPAYSKKCMSFKEYKNRHLITVRDTKITTQGSTKDTDVNATLNDKITDISNNMFHIFERKFQELTKNLVDLLTANLSITPDTTVTLTPMSKKRPINKISIKKTSNDAWTKVKRTNIAGNDEDTPLSSGNETNVTSDGERMEAGSSHVSLGCCASRDAQPSGGT